MQIQLRALRVPKVMMAGALAILVISVLAHRFAFPVLVYFVGMIMVATVVDAFFVGLQKQKLFPLWAAVITGFIVALLIPPKEVSLAVVAVIVAMASKHFLKFHGRHIFNPAGFGLFVAAVLFQTTVSWWAVSFQQPSLQLGELLVFGALLLPGVVSVWRLKRYRIILSFLVAYIVLNGLLHQSEKTFSLSSLLTDPTVLFFALVMLPEPMTSPNRPMAQVAYGAGVALLALLLSLPIFQPIAFLIPDVFVVALLVGNIAFINYR